MRPLEQRRNGTTNRKTTGSMIRKAMSYHKELQSGFETDEKYKRGHGERRRIWDIRAVHSATRPLGSNLEVELDGTGGAMDSWGVVVDD